MTQNSTKTKRGNRIFKKNSSSKGWTYMKQVRGRRYYFPLGSIISDAKTLADQIDAYSFLHPISDVVKKYRPNGLRTGSEGTDNATVGDIAKRFKLLAPSECGVEPSTIKTYLTVFRRVVREATGRDPDKVYISDFTPSLISEFKRKRLDGVTDHSERISIKRTINSYMSQVQGVFSKKAQKIYKDFDIRSALETLEDFSPYEKVGVKYKLPSFELIEKTHNLLDIYENKSDQYIALALALHFGLRRSEIMHSKRGWFSKVKDKYRLGVFTEESFRVKAGEDGYAFGSSVIAEKILSKSDGFDYLITGGRRGVFDPILKDLRSIGWDRKKPLHECRKLYGSFWASKEGLYFAQKTLRHATPLTTNDYYADLIDQEDVMNLWSA